jgi:hypothetical protein
MGLPKLLNARQCRETVDRMSWQGTFSFSTFAFQKIYFQLLALLFYFFY